MPGSTITRGNIATTVLLSASLTPVAVSANTTAEQSFAILGLIPGDQVSQLSYQSAFTVNVDVANVRVPSANTLTVAYQNNTGGSVTPPAGTYLVEVNRPEFLPLPANVV